MKLVSASGPGERVKALKEVGDTALYVVGFFAESLERSLVQADYYMGLGSAAYGELASRLGGSSVREVYEELASGFPAFVDVLGEVRTPEARIQTQQKAAPGGSVVAIDGEVFIP